MKRIAAFDLSLTATGWCESTGEEITWGTINTKLTGFPRFQYIVNLAATKAQNADLVVMEDLAFGANMPGATERTGLAYLLRYVLWLRHQPFVLVAPAALKKFVTGNGKAEKSAVVLAVYKRFSDHNGNPISCSTNDEADAVGLAFIGRALVGDWDCTSEAQREVLAKLKAA